MTTQEQRLYTSIFKKGSKTYFNSSLFFPKKVRDDVFILYGFVRVADNFVDTIPQDREGFYRFRDLYRKTWKAEEYQPSGNPIIDNFIALARRKHFDPAWTEAFLQSMEWDLDRHEYNRLEDTLAYIYGSAEVIGLFMAAILDLPRRSWPYAQALGRSMQYINFIRDIEEDTQLGRRYLPLGESGLNSLHREEALAHPQAFIRFIREQAALYNQWQEEASQGYPYIPPRYLIPIKTAADMYAWTARQIMKDPFIVFQKKVKPSRGRILFTILKNSMQILFGGYH